MHDNGYLQLFSHDSFSNGVPHKTFARLRKEAPLSWEEGDAGTKGFWNLTRHEDITLANRESTIFSSAQGIRLEDQSHEEYMARRTFQETDAPEHSTTRRNALIGNSDPEFTDHVIDKMDTNEFRMMPFRSPAGLKLYEYAGDILAGRRAVENHGVLASMMKNENGLNELDFKNFFCLLVAAGNDTTRYSIAMALNLLAHDPVLISQLKTGKYWDSCADEFITQDYELHGKTIREGDKVLLWFVSGSRDEAVFENPNDCLLDRKPNRHLAFGQGGIHVCLGMHLAKLEVKIVLQELVKRIDSFQAIDTPTWTRSNFICGVKRLNVRARVL